MGAMPGLMEVPCRNTVNKVVVVVFSSLETLSPELEVVLN